MLAGWSAEDAGGASSRFPFLSLVPAHAGATSCRQFLGDGHGRRFQLLGMALSDAPSSQGGYFKRFLSVSPTAEPRPVLLLLGRRNKAICSRRVGVLEPLLCFSGCGRRRPFPHPHRCHLGALRAVSLAVFCSRAISSSSPSQSFLSPPALSRGVALGSERPANSHMSSSQPRPAGQHCLWLPEGLKMKARAAPLGGRPRSSPSVRLSTRHAEEGPVPCAVGTRWSPRAALPPWPVPWGNPWACLSPDGSPFPLGEGSVLPSHLWGYRYSSRSYSCPSPCRACQGAWGLGSLSGGSGGSGGPACGTAQSPQKLQVSAPVETTTRRDAHTVSRSGKSGLQAGGCLRVRACAHACEGCVVSAARVCCSYDRLYVGVMTVHLCVSVHECVLCECVAVRQCVCVRVVCFV